MKKIFNTLCVSLTLIAAACGSGSKDYALLGRMTESGFENAKVYLVEPNGMRWLDSAVITNGAFRFEGVADTVRMAEVVALSADNRTRRSMVVLEPGTISLDLVSDSLAGTPMNDLYYRKFVCDTFARTMAEQLQAMVEQYYSAMPDEQDRLKAEYLRMDSLLTAHNTAHCQEVFEQNGDNIIGAYALNCLAQYKQMRYEELDGIMNRSSAAVAEYRPLVALRDHLFNVANTSEGKRYVDISGIDYATGESTTLGAMLDSSEVTLLDFWASWCAPCRREISDNLVRLYAEYGNKGLNIIGIDVWDKLPEHSKAVEQLGIRYPQLIDTTRSATDSYGVSGIPMILLLDKDGTILRRDLRGDDIEPAIREALGMK